MAANRCAEVKATRLRGVSVNYYGFYVLHFFRRDAFFCVEESPSVSQGHLAVTKNDAYMVYASPMSRWDTLAWHKNALAVSGNLPGSQTESIRGLRLLLRTLFTKFGH